MRDLPTGTVTFLFTDVEGSTKLLHELGAEGYAEALAEHRQVIREACAAGGGVEVDTQGDAFFFAFPTAPGAVAAAARPSPRRSPWARSGYASACTREHRSSTEEGYVGDDVHFAARVAAAARRPGHPLAGDRRARGTHLHRPRRAPAQGHRRGGLDLPARRGLLPAAQDDLEHEPAPSCELLPRAGARACECALEDRGRAPSLTLTGPGGTGKTRLALEAASTLVPEYRAGVFWVGARLAHAIPRSSPRRSPRRSERRTGSPSTSASASSCSCSTTWSR